MAIVESSTVERFEINFSDEVLADLRSRLRNTRWAPDPDNADWHHGVPTAYLQSLVQYWLEEFDWRAAEARIMAYDHFRTEVDGVPIHFMSKPGVGPNPIPLLLVHGWPWTFWDYSRVVDQLADPSLDGGDPADAFDVIIPSVPGFAFSNPYADLDMNFVKIADLMHSMMTERLGYPRFAAAGGDLGALVAAQLGHKYADSMYGIHLTHDIPLDLLQNERPWDVTGGAFVPEDASDELREDILALTDTYASHVAVHMLDGQTLTHGLMDSPVGMLAWILERWHHWSDQRQNFDEVFPRDHLLTNATIWWATGCIGPSLRHYSHYQHFPWKPSHDRKPQIEAPAGFTFYVGDQIPPGTRTVEARKQAFLNGHSAEWFNTVHLSVTDAGGHFGPFENPKPFIDGLRENFRTLR
jgi:pimeloyl-ACP methyl ester carboxylesterase